jgi:hypothetical protein
MVRKILLPFFILAGFMLAGCGDYGKVEQGSAVAYDKDKSIVTIVADTNTDVKKPANYTELPVHSYALPPAGSEDRGADPDAGLCVNLDVEKKIITMYNPKEQKLENISFEVVEDIHQRLRVNRRSQLVLPGEKVFAGVKTIAEFPIVDEAKKTVQILYRRQFNNQMRLTTFKLSDADFAKYKGKEWNAGCEVRIYYKEGWTADGKPGQSLRFMNITKTDITRR